MGRAIRFREKMELNLRIEFANVFNRAEAPNPVSTNSAATQQRNAQGVPTAGFGADLHHNHRRHHEHSNSDVASGYCGSEVYFLKLVKQRLAQAARSGQDRANPSGFLSGQETRQLRRKPRREAQR